jgi:hypothetical protein
VASAIARSHTCRLLSTGPSEGHGLLKTSKKVGRVLVFDSSGCENTTETCVEYFSVPGILGVKWLSYAFKVCVCMHD